MSYGTETIEELLTLSITDLKRLGLLRPGAACSGAVRWTCRGTETASIAIATDTRPDVPTIRYNYAFNGAPVEYTTPLRFKPSNLNRGGYFLFVCPVTGRSCRKLYLIGGRFVSRYAFRGLYEKQLQSRARRSGLYAYLDAVTEYERMREAKGRKLHYRGNLTPYGRKVERLREKVGRLAQVAEADAHRDRAANRCDGQL